MPDASPGRSRTPFAPGSQSPTSRATATPGRTGPPKASRHLFSTSPQKHLTENLFWIKRSTIPLWGSPMLQSTASAMAIRATLFLALQPPGTLSPVREIASRTGLPEPYLAKIVRQLTSAGLVRAFRGPGGGIALVQPPRTISLWSIVRAIEGPVEAEWCVLGLHTCLAETPCPIHSQYARLRSEVQHLLERTTLATLLRRLRKEGDFDGLAWLASTGDSIRRPSGKTNGKNARVKSRG
jgi:Rrf2 family transcriptional regulator, iron-sulfur cluster assembly transcription factor